MKKLVGMAVNLLASVALLTNAQAQQAPAAATPQAPAAKAAPAPAAGAQTAPAAKTAQAATPKTAAAPLVLKTPKDKASYALGMNVGKGPGANLKQQSVEVNQAILLRGLRDALAGSKTLLTDEEMKAALTQLQTEVRVRQMEKQKLAAEAGKKEGAEFMEANKTKEGVVTLPSGLQYKILTAGTGPKPTETDSVTCNYRGTLLNGTEFDSSNKHGHPETFPVNGVVKGWTEALQLMPVGSKWQLFVPSELGYGDRGADPRSGIGPGATLIFELELISIQPKDAKDKEKPEAPPK
jgi:FKBP-type peptidyl-prolyl cis-trans isomerase FklB